MFPSYRKLLPKISEILIGDLPSGPFPADQLAYKSDRIVEYVTPTGADGLGTESRLAKNGEAVRGVVMLVGEELDLFRVATRLPNEVASVIIRQVERDARRR